jgi:hypothetical protein
MKNSNEPASTLSVQILFADAKYNEGDQGKVFLLMVY